MTYFIGDSASERSYFGSNWSGQVSALYCSLRREIAYCTSSMTEVSGMERTSCSALTYALAHLMIAWRCVLKDERFKFRYVVFFGNWRTAYLIFFTPCYFLLWFLFFACTFGDACILTFSSCFGFNFSRCSTVPREMSGLFAVKADFIVLVVVISSFYISCIWRAGHLGYTKQRKMSTYI